MHEKIGMLAPTLLLLDALAPPLVVFVRDFQSLILHKHLPSPKTASISSNGTPIVSGYTGSTLVRTSCHAPARKLTEVNYHHTISVYVVRGVHFSYVPTTKLQAQKNPCIGYRRHSMTSWRNGVISPTKKLKAQLVWHKATDQIKAIYRNGPPTAVDRDTPFARTVNGMI